MNIKEIYKKYHHLDGPISRSPFNAQRQATYEMWTAIKAEAERPKLDWAQLDITPRPAVRQTRGQRDRGYEKYKRDLGWLAKEQRFELGSCFEAIFLIPVYKEWSPEEKMRRHKTPHQAVKGPDADNLEKAVMDALLPDRGKHDPDRGDAGVWRPEATKLWINAEEGYICIRNLNEAEVLAKVRAELEGMGL